MTRRETMQTMSDVANRAIVHLSNQGITQDKLSVMMDLEYVNAVIPLDFDRLLAFDDGNFGHDINGIYTHFDRATKTMGDCFCPRSASDTAKIYTYDDEPKQTQVTDESYAVYKMYKGKATDEQLDNDFPNWEHGYGTGSAHDCSGRWFCSPARVIRNRFRTLVVQRWLLDI